MAHSVVSVLIARQISCVKSLICRVSYLHVQNEWNEKRHEYVYKLKGNKGKIRLNINDLTFKAFVKFYFF